MAKERAARISGPLERVKVVLACGDQVTVRNPPLHSTVRYGCTAGQGHGYNIEWISYTDRGLVSYNPRYRPETGDADS